jgi:hypothetical protein
MQVNSMIALCESSFLCDPIERRLAFRELGLSIGIHGLEWTKGIVMQDDELATILNRLLEHASLIEQIQGFWPIP